ncbi:MAG: hypothetical protein IJT59_02465 [Desulfovibrionaceae bacterium]|nr:hypothetical protein [Desulfovibrionaceae bacterium]
MLVNWPLLTNFFAVPESTQYIIYSACALSLVLSLRTSKCLPMPLQGWFVLSIFGFLALFGVRLLADLIF